MNELRCWVSVQRAEGSLERKVQDGIGRWCHWDGHCARCSSSSAERSTQCGCCDIHQDRHRDRQHHRGRPAKIRSRTERRAAAAAAPSRRNRRRNGLALTQGTLRSSATSVPTLRRWAPRCARCAISWVRWWSCRRTCAPGGPPSLRPFPMSAASFGAAGWPPFISFFLKFDLNVNFELFLILLHWF